MVERALKLRRDLEGVGVQPVEVYPYASKVRLLRFEGRYPPKKRTLKGRRWAAAELHRFIKGKWDDDLDDDRADALLAAYTAFLFGRDAAEPLGDEPEGQIWLPQMTTRGAQPAPH
jgi:predicted nuclease with RNAse H fold